jgi:uncharacterized protein YcgI (DUF1989 family)|tara:strand:- start:187 stop:957 length:771 start_codon:yes stop_codon:yes gene_type:complete
MRCGHYLSRNYPPDSIPSPQFDYDPTDFRATFRPVTLKSIINESSISTILDQELAPATGIAVIVKIGQRLRVTDLHGLQVVDMAIFNAGNVREKLSCSYSRTRAGVAGGGDFHPHDHLTEGDVLMSTINREMMRITADTPEVKGMHDVHGRMCNRKLYQALGEPDKDGCHEIISAAVEAHGIKPEDIPDTMDLFMNYHHDCENRWWVLEDGVSKSGDYIEFEALMDCLVALSNCPFYRGTPMRVEVFEADTTHTHD